METQNMAQDPLFIIVILAMAVVAIILMIGIGGFGRGGEFNRKYANKLMRLRIFAQFIAVLLILLFVYFAR
jgi:preprotein translocase subunit SecG